MKDIDFLLELRKLCSKHEIYMTGRVRILKADDYDTSSFSISQKDSIDLGYATDSSGPFIEFNIKAKPQTFEPVKRSMGYQIMDREKLMNGGVKSMADGEVYTQRGRYETSLKDKGYLLVGDDQKNPKRKKFECEKIIDRQAMSEAYDKVASKYDLKR